MNTAVPRERMAEVLDQVMRDITRQTAGIELQPSSDGPEEPLCTVYIAFVKDFQTSLSLCAETSLFTRLAQCMMMTDQVLPEDVEAVIDGRAPVRKPAQERPRPAAPQRVNLIIDIQQRMAQGKGPAYERWAKIYNLKQMAAALQFLQENGLTDYDALAERTAEVVDRAHALAGELRGVEERLASTTKLISCLPVPGQWPA